MVHVHHVRCVPIGPRRSRCDRPRHRLCTSGHPQEHAVDNGGRDRLASVRSVRGTLVRACIGLPAAPSVSCTRPTSYANDTLSPGSNIISSEMTELAERLAPKTATWVAGCLHCVHARLGAWLLRTGVNSGRALNRFKPTRPDSTESYGSIRAASDGWQQAAACADKTHPLFIAGSTADVTGRSVEPPWAARVLLCTERWQLSARGRGERGEPRSQE